jgi:hypothetical protein
VNSSGGGTGEKTALAAFRMARRYILFIRKY